MLRSVKVVLFILLAASCVYCQQAGARNGGGLPDAPSAEVFQKMADEARVPVTESGSMSASFAGGYSRAAHLDIAILEFEDPVSRPHEDALDRYLPALLKRNLSYHPSMNGSLASRASYAATSILFTQDESGRRKLNTSYFVAVLSSALVRTAYRPYWRRSAADPFSDFGSNIGNDAGMNLMHEFGPGLGQLVKTHAPRFVSKIEERISR